MSKKTFRIILFALFFLGGIYTYKMLKGTSKLALSEDVSDEYVLVGVEFNGSANKQEFKDAFEKIELEKGNKEVPTFMVHYEMEEPSKSNDFHVNTFIGYQAHDTSKEISLPSEYRILHKRQIVRCSSKTNFVFQGRIYPELEKYIAKQGLAVDSSYIVEKYWKDNKIEIEMGVK